MNKSLKLRRYFTTAMVTGLLLVAGTFFAYYFSNPKYRGFYDYTYRVAQQMVDGHIAVTTEPPSWLNEFVLVEGKWYSVFPLGSVLSMVPFAALGNLTSAADMPAALIGGLLAAGISLFLFLISLHYDLTWPKRVLVVLAFLFGTWMWTNVTFGGAWQLALGFAVFGQLGTLYFSAYKPKPIVAGAFFALGFGNRTEILLTAPIAAILLLRAIQQNFQTDRLKSYLTKISIKTVAAFCAIPLLLGISTLVYNQVRFDSPFDFGYARIPGVLEEPWYDQGIFSVSYIPRQAQEMLLKPWTRIDEFPYSQPGGFSSSVLVSSPFLLLLFRAKMRDKILVYLSWLAIFILIVPLWMHGNSGGWQFGYRYAMILLPWIFVLLLENGPRKVTWYEWLLYVFAIVANGYATYLFHWTERIKP